MKKIILVAAIFFAVMFANTVFATGNTVNSGWVNVPVTDTQPFEVNCEYRIDSAPSDEGIHYAIHVAADRIETKYYSTGCFASMLYNNKMLMTSQAKPDIHVVGIQKRCKLPDTAPSGMIGQFALAQCPDGWSTWLFAKATVECNTSNCNIAVCKKD